MSSEKISKLLIDDLVRRIKQEHLIKDDKELADLIGLSAQNFSAKRKKGTVVNDILAWAILNNKDLNLLFKGAESNGRAERKKGNRYLEDVSGWINEMLTKDERNQIWFEVQFEKNFPEFKKWMEAKNEVLEKAPEMKKQSNGSGWK